MADDKKNLTSELNALDTIYRQAAVEEAKKLFEMGDCYCDRASIVGMLNSMPSAQPEPQWIPCSERLPEEDHWLGGSGRQFSDEVLVSVANYDDEDIWTYISQTIDGEWTLELPRHCEIIAWMPMPEPFVYERNEKSL